MISQCEINTPRKEPWHVQLAARIEKMGIDPLDKADRDFDKIEIGLPHTGCPRCDLADELIEMLRARLRTCDIWFTEYWFQLDKAHSAKEDLRKLLKQQRTKMEKEHDSRRTG